MVEIRGRDTLPDPLTGLIEQLAGGPARSHAVRHLAPAVRQAVYPLCLRRLGTREAAEEAVQETWVRLLEHVHRRGPEHLTIDSPTAYVQRVADNACTDVIRTLIRRRPEVGLGEPDTLPPGEPDHDDVTPARGVGTPAERAAARFGYRSGELLAQLAELSEAERTVLLLRQQGRGYPEIARVLGEKSIGTVRTQGERAVQHLRGRIHVRVWLLEPPAEWVPPRCAALAQLQTTVRGLLLAGRPVPVGRYREIGRHLDPDPNAAAGGADRTCAVCAAERGRSETRYWWLLAALPVLFAGEPGPRPTPVAHTTPSIRPAGAAHPPGPRTARRRYRRRAGTAGMLLLFLALFGGVVLLRPGDSNGGTTEEVLAAPVLPSSPLDRLSGSPSPSTGVGEPAVSSPGVSRAVKDRDDQWLGDRPLPGPGGFEPSGPVPGDSDRNGPRSDGVKPGQPGQPGRNGGDANGNEPGGDVPDGDVPDGDVPDGDVPDGDVPDGDVPDGDQPDGDEADGDEAEGDQPQARKPDDGERDGDGPSAVPPPKKYSVRVRAEAAPNLGLVCPPGLACHLAPEHWWDVEVYVGPERVDWCRGDSVFHCDFGEFPEGTVVTLKARGNNALPTAVWSGCDRTDPCTVTVHGDRTPSVVFKEFATR
jgi:RNA polymerase sigma factor (sigma-70 family)